MSFHIVTRRGNTVRSPSRDHMIAALNELDEDDPEHPDCWLTHEAGWTLSVFAGGRIVFANDEEDTPSRHLPHVSRERALRMWLSLAAGDLASLEAEDWHEGSHAPLSEQELRTQREEMEQFYLERDREFYDSLGPERESPPCRREGCNRGAVQFSVLCRRHHVESLTGRACSFTH
jgi:hypothetical protein